MDTFYDQDMASLFWIQNLRAIHTPFVVGGQNFLI